MTNPFTQSEIDEMAESIKQDEGRMALFEMLQTVIGEYDKLKWEHNEVKEDRDSIRRILHSGHKDRPARITVEYLDDEGGTCVIECDILHMNRRKLLQKLPPENGFERKQDIGIRISTLVAYSNPEPITDEP